MRRLIANYTYHQLLAQWRRKDFAVEVIPMLKGHPPRRGRHDCFHYNGRTQTVIGLKLGNNLVEPPSQRMSVHAGN